MSIYVALLSIIAILVFWVVAVYNGLVSLVNRTKEAWADIDVQLKRRYDLIPNLIETVKGYAVHESGVFQKVTEARSNAMKAGSVQEKQATENMLSQTLKSLFAVSEAYPELKANQNFLSLQSELSDTENKIQAARRFYNGNVRDLNTKLEIFPSNVIGEMFKFETQAFFDLGDANAVERKPVAVKF